MSREPIVVSGAFDDMRFADVRFLDEASRFGEVHALLWPDETVRALTGREPKFPAEERLYFLRAIRYVSRVTLAGTAPDALPPVEGAEPAAWVVRGADDTPGKRAFCRERGIGYRVIPEAALAVIPQNDQQEDVPSSRKKVLVTGCFDWLHSGHVRFFEEAAEYGDLYVVVGHDANIRLLKGDGHPLFPEGQRRYLAGAIRFVYRALVSSGNGWMDAEPEIARFRPDIYLVNEDGDRPEKRAFCQEHGLEYVVLKRLPKEGLPRRQSTDLRGF